MSDGYQEEEESGTLGVFPKGEEEYESRIYQEALIFENLQHVYHSIRKGGTGWNDTALLLESLTTPLSSQVSDDVNNILNDYNRIHEKIIKECEKEDRKNHSYCGGSGPSQRCNTWGEHNLRIYTVKRTITIVQDMLDKNGMLFRKRSQEMGEAGGY